MITATRMPTATVTMRSAARLAAAAEAFTGTVNVAAAVPSLATLSISSPMEFTSPMTLRRRNPSTFPPSSSSSSSYSSFRRSSSLVARRSSSSGATTTTTKSGGGGGKFEDLLKGIGGGAEASSVHVLLDPSDSPGGGDPYGSREYVLLPRDVDLEGLSPQRQRSIARKFKLAGLRAKGSVMYGASLSGDLELSGATLVEGCGTLVDRARGDAEVHGEQVQALAALHGLCDWVARRLEDADADNDDGGGGSGSAVLDGLLRRSAAAEGVGGGGREGGGDDAADADVDAAVVLGAVRAIATGVPRPGHTVVGAGTYRDGEVGWIALAREFAELGGGDGDGADCPLAQEVELYRSKGAVVADVIHLADRSGDYLRSAGGAMVRLFFV